MWKKLFTEKVQTQLYSFAKTYLTVFLTLYLYLVVDGKTEGTALVLLNLPSISIAAQWAFVAVIRNVYKLVTEK